MSDEPAFLSEAVEESAARDLELMLRVKAGDLEAFEELVETHQHRVVGTIAKMLGDEFEAEDLAQQASSGFGGAPRGMSRRRSSPPGSSPSLEISFSTNSADVNATQPRRWMKPGKRTTTHLAIKSPIPE